MFSQPHEDALTPGPPKTEEMQCCAITMYTQVHEEESSPLLCGFTATLFGSMPLAYEDSVKVKMV